MGGFWGTTVQLYYKITLEVEDDDKEMKLPSTDILQNIKYLKKYLNQTYPQKIKHPILCDISYEIEDAGRLTLLKPV